MPTFPHIALPLAVVAALGIAPLAAADREPPPPPPPPPQEEYWSDKPPKENIQWERPLEACSNMGRKITCPVWLKCLDDRKKKGQGTEPPKSETEHLSLVDNRSFNYIHWANDYRLLPVDGDCVPCVDDEDQVLPGVRYPILEWIRVHRYRDTSEHSSFGPGVYSPYDLHLQIDRFGNQASDPHRVVVIDPSDLEKSVNADPDGDGRFTGVRGNRIDGIRFYDSAGDQVLTPDGAKTGVLTTFDGERQHFDIFDLASGLPAPWRHGAIGDVNQIGSVSHRDGSFELSASGSDIWNTRDEFGYVYQAVTGDVEIVARVDRIRTPVGLFEEDSDFWAKVGLMIRAGLSDDVAHASIFATPGVSAFQWRESTGSSSGSHHQGRSPGPVWLKLVRSGDQFSGATSTDGNTWTQIGSHSIPMGAVVYVGLATTSHRDGTKTDGSYSGVSLDATPVAESAWPMPASGAPATAIQLAGRLTRREDRFGYGVSVSYRDWSPVELDESPDRRWQIDRIEDDLGHALEVGYHPLQVGGRWVIDQVVLPNGETLDYHYTDHLLSAVDHPDGTRSSFDFALDPDSQMVSVDYFDASADDIHRRKQALLTSQYQVSTFSPYHYYVTNQSSMLLRRATNGEGEVTYANFFLGDRFHVVVYEGGGKLKQVHNYPHNEYVRFFLKGWSFEPDSEGLHDVVGELEPTYHVANYHSTEDYRINRAHDVQRANGVHVTYETDADGFRTRRTFSDGSSEHWSYGAFKQLTRYQDRLGRVTRYQHDGLGNLLVKEVGLLRVGSEDVIQSADHGRFEYRYYPPGHPHQHLLAAEIDANGNRTDYVYNDRNFLVRVIEPADAAAASDPISRARAERRFEYDSAGRLAARVDASGRRTSYSYDARSRITTITHPDGSMERRIYGHGEDANLLVREIDRRGHVTDHDYDRHGRRTRSVSGALVANSDGNSTSPVGDPAARVEEVCTYLHGTNLKNACIRKDQTTRYLYDHRHRLVATYRNPTAGQLLVERTDYGPDNVVRREIDAYDRSRYFDYRDSDRALIRQVQGLVPEDGLGDWTVAASVGRDAGPNPAYLVTDFELDAEAQQVAVIDPRGVRHEQVFDSRGRMVERIEAASDPTIAARTVQVFDPQSNLVELRSPRSFDAGDSVGFGRAITRMGYTDRNLLASRSVAAGSPEQATERFTYHLDRRLRDRIDFRGNRHTTFWGASCARIQAELEPALTLPGASTPTRPARITRHDDNGNLAHVAQLSDYDGSVFPGPGSSNASDLPDALTITETTTRYDSRNRPVARTVWLEPRGTVDANHAPIADRPSPQDPTVARIPVMAATAPASAGLTTTWHYDDDLFEAGVLGAAFHHPDGSPLNVPYPVELSGLGIGVYAWFSAEAVVDPESGVEISVRDGLGRVVRRFDPEGNATTIHHHQPTAPSDLPMVDPAIPIPGTLLATTVSDPLGHRTLGFADAAERVLVAADELGFATGFAYDAGGNRLRRRDPNGVGEDSSYDQRGRETIRIDTAGDLRFRIYDANDNLVQTVDGEGATPLGASGYPASSQTRLPSSQTGVTSCDFDARDRLVACDDRLPGVNRSTYAYDANGNLVALSDAEGGLTAYDYDVRDLVVAERFPGHDADETPSSGDSDGDGSSYDQRRYAYDGAGRLVLRSDQLGIHTHYGYDRADRLLQRRYLDGIAAGASPVEAADRFAWDHAGRLLEAESGRYANRRQQAWHPDGRLAEERLVIDGRSYVVGYAYDAGNRITGITYPSGQILEQGFTARDQLSTLTAAGRTIASFEYDQGGRERRRDFANGRSTSRRYDRGDDLVTAIRGGSDHNASGVIEASEAVVVDFSYDYDANKRKRNEADARLPMLDQTFDYDGEDRLIAWSRPSAVDPTIEGLPARRSWQLSTVGDWTSVTTDGAFEFRRHDAVHQLLVRQPQVGPTRTLDYNHRGEMLADGAGRGFAWDPDNLLRRAVVDTQSISYRYDALGRRVAKETTDSDTDRLYVGSGSRVLTEYAELGQPPHVPLRSYVYAGAADDPVVQVDHQGASGHFRAWFLHANHQGSVAALTDASGAVVERYGYGAYGSVQVYAADGSAATPNRSAVGNPHRFAGLHLDQDSGLMLLGSRPYDAGLGRFINRHPDGYAEGLNLYQAWFGIPDREGDR